MTAELAALSAHQVPEATALCVRAFADYPFLTSLFPGPADRRAPLTAVFYGRTIEDCLAHGRVDVVIEDREVRAVAAWLPPGTYPMSLRRTLRFAPLVGRSSGAGRGAR